MNSLRTDREKVKVYIKNIDGSSITNGDIESYPELFILVMSDLFGFCRSFLDDCNTLEAEVERLREENETLKKQMEDDLK